MKQQATQPWRGIVGGDSLPARLGQVVDGVYEIRALLGQGGMGQVYEAYDLRLRRRVAVKFALPVEGAPSLLQEAQALAALRDPGVPAVHTAGVIDGAEFIVMEMVHGETLEARLDRAPERRLAVGEALELIDGIARVLGVAHALGLAHRDVKPSNVMLCAGGRIVLLDFGLHIPECRHPSGPPSGTPAYMAPEQIHGAALPGQGYAADLYALGCVAFELFTGSPPFAALEVNELLRMHLGDPPPRLSAARSDIPAPIDALVAELLEKDPSDRPSCAEDVRARIDSYRRTARPSEAPLRAAATSTAVRIAVVEDDSMTLQAVCAIARSAVPGALVTAFRDAETALPRLRRGEFDVLLLDLGLPGLGGVELAARLAAAGPSRPSIIAFSAKLDANQRRRLSAAGVSDILRKGPDVARRLTAVLRHHALSA